jgi:putative ABC transport system permease protein
MVLMQGMRLFWIGVAVGLVGAFGLSRVIASFLFGVKALDPAVYATVPVLLWAVALFALWFPARRAAHHRPLTAVDPFRPPPPRVCDPFQTPVRDTSWMA